MNHFVLQAFDPKIHHFRDPAGQLVHMFASHRNRCRKSNSGIVRARYQRALTMHEFLTFGNDFDAEHMYFRPGTIIYDKRGKHWDEVRIILDIIPIYDGKNIRLSNFITCCNIARKEAPNIGEKHLTDIILSRLRGVAYEVMQGEIFCTFEEIISQLISFFLGRKSYDELLVELRTFRQGSHETIMKYVGRCKSMLADFSLHMQHHYTNEKRIDYETKLSFALMEGLLCPRVKQIMKDRPVLLPIGELCSTIVNEKRKITPHLKMF